MSATTIPNPGHPGGPCEDKCSHLECELHRARAESLCVLCNKPIDYDRIYFRSAVPTAPTDPLRDRLTHATCQWAQEDGK